MRGIKILSIASYTPETVINNDDFTAFIETSDEWITTRTGIKTRHYAMGMPTYKLGSNAAEKAIEKSGISKDEIDLIICTTVTPNTLVPSTACLIQRELVNQLAREILEGKIIKNSSIEVDCRDGKTVLRNR